MLTAAEETCCKRLILLRLLAEYSKVRGYGGVEDGLERAQSFEVLSLEGLETDLIVENREG